MGGLLEPESSFNLESVLRPEEGTHSSWKALGPRDAVR